jgi:hypothetical protein
MAYDRFGGSIMKPNGAGETNMSPAPDVLQYASSILQYQQQMLRLTSLAADTLRLMLRQTQRQIDYMHALSRCQDLTSVGAVTTEFAQQVNQEVSGEWREVSHLTERWIDMANQSNRTVADSMRSSRSAV